MSEAGRLKKGRAEREGGAGTASPYSTGTSRPSCAGCAVRSAELTSQERIFKDDEQPGGGEGGGRSVDTAWTVATRTATGRASIATSGKHMRGAQR